MNTPKTARKYKSVEDVFRTHIPGYRPSTSMLPIDDPENVGKQLANSILRDLRQSLNGKNKKTNKREVSNSNR